MYRWRVFNEQAKKRNIAVSISFDEYSKIVRTACSYCGEFTYEGYSGVDRVQNVGSYEIDNVVVCCKTCNFMKGPSSGKEFLGKVEQIAKLQQAPHAKGNVKIPSRLLLSRSSFTTRP